jgi:hypothetical protein
MHRCFTLCNMTTPTNIPSGSRVRLPDGTIATCYRDCGIGRPWAGRYVCVQTVNGIERRDTGWRAEQLEVLP